MLIAFLSDWGLKSYYVGVCKAVIYSINPEAKVIDLTHEVEPFCVREAMHILYRAYRDFPPRTVFLAVVDYGVGTERKAIAFSTKSGYLFVGPDNGLFTLIAKEDIICEVRELSNTSFFYKKEPSSSFHGRDIFAPCAAFLSKGTPLENFGSPLSGITFLNYQKPQLKKDKIVGEIAFFDRFGNIETNIPEIWLSDQKGLKFYQKLPICIDSKMYMAYYVPTYGNVPRGEILLHGDSSGFLEIAVNQGNAREKLKVKTGSVVEVYLPQ